MAVMHVWLRQECPTPGCSEQGRSSAKFKSHFSFLFLFDDRARQNETNLRLSSEVIRNLKLSSHILLTCTSTCRLACFIALYNN